MKGKLTKRLALGAATLSTLLVLILAVHIRIVTRHKAIDPQALVMARIDLHQQIGKQDADKIVSYMNAKPCVSHAVVNLNTDNVVFTFFPSQASGNEIVRQFKDDLHYSNAVRYLPTLSAMSGGCPMGYGGGSLLSRILHFFK